MENGIVEFKGLGDNRGLLVSLESLKNVPFEFKRVYYITELNGVERRGFHAHKKLLQLAVCVSGSCDFVLDDGTERQTFRLDSPTKGLLIGNLIWREMVSFTPDCVILVLASEYYDESDYIRNYDDFKRLVNETSAK